MYRLGPQDDARSTENLEIAPQLSEEEASENLENLQTGSQGPEEEGKVLRQVRTCLGLETPRGIRYTIQKAQLLSL